MKFVEVENTCDTYLYAEYKYVSLGGEKKLVCKLWKIKKRG